MRIVAFIFFISITLSSCSKSDTGSITPGLKPYYDSFLLEAETRNIQLSESQIDIRMLFSDINSNGTLGQCTYLSGVQDVVEIDRSYWGTFDETMKEFVVFHELGHCILGLGHRDGVDANGNCLSLMHSSVELCKFDFTGANRDLYLDELFQ